MVIGIIIGAFIAAYSADELKLRVPPWKTLLQTFGGGLLMGFGAVTSGGCNIGHILSGVPQLALSSIFGGIFIVLGAWTASYFLFIRPLNKGIASKSKVSNLGGCVKNSLVQGIDWVSNVSAVPSFAHREYWCGNTGSNNMQDL